MEWTGFAVRTDVGVTEKSRVTPRKSSAVNGTSYHVKVNSGERLGLEEKLEL